MNIYIYINFARHQQSVAAYNALFSSFLALALTVGAACNLYTSPYLLQLFINHCENWWKSSLYIKEKLCRCKLYVPQNSLDTF